MQAAERLGPGGRAADAGEQPASGRRRAARRTSSSTAGSARRRATRRALEAIKRELTRLEDHETLLVQSGKPVGVFETHPDAPRVLIANSNLVPDWATWKHFRELDAAGLMMYGQMTAGSWIYIGTQGILPGHLRDVRRARAPAVRRLAARQAGGDRRARRHGRRPAAGGDDERGLRAVRGGRPAADRAPDRDRVPRRAGGLARRRARHASRPPAARAARSRSACSATPPRCCPSSCAAASEIDVVTDQTSAHDPLYGYVPAGLTVEQADALRESDPDDYLRRVGESALAHVGRDPRPARPRAPRRSTTATRCAGSRPSTATTTRSPTPASSPPTSGRCSARARARSGGSRCPAIPADIAVTDDAILDLFGDQDAHPPLDRARARARAASRACRRGSAGSATASATSPGCASTSWSPRRREGARS